MRSSHSIMFDCGPCVFVSFSVDMHCVVAYRQNRGCIAAKLLVALQGRHTVQR